MSEVSWELTIELYRLSGWEGVAEWFTDRPLTADNSPCYTLGYLLRRLRELRPAIAPAELLGVVAERIEESGMDFEDAAASLCVQFLKHRLLEEARS